MANIVIPLAPGGCRVSSRLATRPGLPATRLVSFPPPPKTVKLELTSRCNYGCKACRRAARDEESGEMAWPLFTRLVGEIADAGIREMGLFYLGEPFLYDWLPDAVDYAKARGIDYVFLSTNGSVATAQRVKKCLEAGLDSLQFSFNHAHESQFAEATGAHTALFHTALANLKAARRLRDEGAFACALQATSLRFNATHQERMQHVVCDVLPYVDEHYWLPVYTTSGEWAGPRPENARRPLPCPTLFTEAHVTFDGKLSACSFETGERWEMASVAEGFFIDGWRSTRYARLREAHLRGELNGTPCEACLVSA